MNRKFYAVVLVLILSLSVFLVGCGGGSSQSSSQPSSTSGSSAPANTSSGSSSGGSGAAESVDEYVIGVIGPMTGGSSAFGVAQIDSVELAVEEINNAGGINGAQIRLIVEDDQADPSKGVTIAQKFVTRDKVDAVIGPVNTGVALAAAPVLEGAGIPTITALPTNDNVTEGQEYLFQLSAVSSMQAEFLAEYIKEMGLKVGIIHDTTAWGEGNKIYALEALEKAGIDPVAVESLTVGKNDYSPQLLNLQKAGAEIIIGGILGAEAAILAKNAKQVNYDAPIIGPNAIAQQSLLDLGKEDVEGLVFTSVFDQNKPEVKQFQEAFQAKHGYVPDLEWFTLAYDAVYLLKAAFEEGGKDKEKVKDAILNINGFQAVSGKAGSTFKFGHTPGRNIALGPESVDFLWVQDGKFVKYDR